MTERYILPPRYPERGAAVLGGVKSSLCRLALLTPSALCVARKLWATRRGDVSILCNGNEEQFQEGLRTPKDTNCTGQIRLCTTAFDSEGYTSDRRVRLTATRTFAHASRSVCFSNTRQSDRLQQLVSSDPNMHRAPKIAHQECEWKRGEQVVFSCQTNTYTRRIKRHLCVFTHAETMVSCRDGPLKSAVNGRREKYPFSLDTEGPSHGSPRRCEIHPRFRYLWFSVPWAE